MSDERDTFKRDAATRTRFVAGGHNVHIPRMFFLKLLRFSGFQQCHICGKRTYLLVDHDHRSQLVRGLLCNACNLLVGDYERVAAAGADMRKRIAAYLSNPPCKQLGIEYQYIPYQTQIQTQTQIEQEKMA